MKKLVKPPKRQFGEVSLYYKETTNKNSGTCANTGAYTCLNKGNAGVCNNTGSGTCTTMYPDVSSGM